MRPANLHAWTLLGQFFGSAFSSTFSALCEWAEAQGLIRREEDFAFFERPTDGEGNEHQAWFDEPSNRWFKVTYHNRFGLAWGRDETATPHEYLLRLLLQNQYFSDDIRLVALINCDEKLRVLISQPHIAGDPATYEQIQAWFTERGFNRFEVSSRIAWYYKPENLLIADAHEGNVIRTAAGTLVPIDLNIVQPRGKLLKWTISMIP